MKTNVHIFHTDFDPLDRWTKRRKKRVQKHLVASLKDTHRKELEDEVR